MLLVSSAAGGMVWCGSSGGGKRWRGKIAFLLVLRDRLMEQQATKLITKQQQQQLLSQLIPEEKKEVQLSWHSALYIVFFILEFRPTLSLSLCKREREIHSERKSEQVIRKEREIFADPPMYHHISLTLWPIYQKNTLTTSSSTITVYSCVMSRRSVAFNLACFFFVQRYNFSHHHLRIFFPFLSWSSRKWLLAPIISPFSSCVCLSLFLFSCGVEQCGNHKNKSGTTN